MIYKRNQNVVLSKRVNEEFHPAKSAYLNHAIAVIYMIHVNTVIYGCLRKQNKFVIYSNTS